MLVLTDVCGSLTAAGWLGGNLRTEMEEEAGGFSRRKTINSLRSLILERVERRTGSDQGQDWTDRGCSMFDIVRPRLNLVFSSQVQSKL